MHEKSPLTPEEIAAREAIFRAKEAELAAEQAAFEAEKAAANTDRNADPLDVFNKLKKDGFPSFVAPKERLYSKLNVSVRTMDIIIGVTVVAIVAVLLLGFLQK